jgi:MoaA/NifB/PqqE/SkfB family radical SAM enzyme
MCGNLGDPIIAKDTVEIFRYIRSINETMRLKMHTNGSARSKKWWKDLAELRVEVIFGIDGLEDTHHLYRVDTDWKRVIDNAVYFINAGGVARWDMLIFKHNEHQVEACRQLSKELGFAEFIVKHSSRFKDVQLEVIDDDYNVVHVIHPTEKSSMMTPKVEKTRLDTLPEITCKAKTGKSIYVSATGSVSPCCWLDFEWIPQYSPFRIDYMTKIKQMPNLHLLSLKEIFDTGYFEKVERCWSSTGLKECSKQCGHFDKHHEQYVK